MPIDHKIRLIINEIDNTALHLKELEDTLASNNIKMQPTKSFENKNDLGNLFGNNGENHSQAVHILEVENKNLKIIVGNQQKLLVELLQELKVIMKQINNIEKEIGNS